MKSVWTWGISEMIVVFTAHSLNIFVGNDPYGR